MSLMIALPEPLGDELASQAQREGVSAAEHATLLLYLATALLKGESLTPFQEAVRSFLVYHSLDAGRIASVLEELVRVCLESRGEKGTPFLDAAGDTAARSDLTLGLHWRNAIAHAVDVRSGVPVSDHPLDATPQPTEQRQPDADDGRRTPHEAERDPDLVARVKRIRGKFARSGDVLASEALHRERQADKKKEEQHVSGGKP